MPPCLSTEWNECQGLVRWQVRLCDERIGQQHFVWINNDSLLITQYINIMKMILQTSVEKSWRERLNKKRNIVSILRYQAIRMWRRYINHKEIVQQEKNYGSLEDSPDVATWVAESEPFYRIWKVCSFKKEQMIWTRYQCILQCKLYSDL